MLQEWIFSGLARKFVQDLLFYEAQPFLASRLFAGAVILWTAMDDIFGLISVRPPYCALEDVELGYGSATATVRRSYPMQHEQGAIAAAEVGRHLAIAGAAAAATRNPMPGKHFYLARSARIERVADATPQGGALTRFRVEATSEGVLKRRASAVAVLKQQQADRLVDLYRIRVDYDVITPAIYLRMVRGLASVDMAALQEENIFDVPLVPVLDTDGVACAEILVKPEYCFGHFPEYPAFPVAKLMHVLSNLAGDHLGMRLERPGARYVVERAEVAAEQLPFAGSAVKLRSRFAGLAADGCHHFVCEARVGADVCGAMDLFLRAVD